MFFRHVTIIFIPIISSRLLLHRLLRIWITAFVLVIGRGLKLIDFLILLPIFLVISFIIIKPLLSQLLQIGVQLLYRFRLSGVPYCFLPCAYQIRRVISQAACVRQPGSLSFSWHNFRHIF